MFRICVLAAATIVQVYPSDALPGSSSPFQLAAACRDSKPELLGAVFAKVSPEELQAKPQDQQLGLELLQESLKKKDDAVAAHVSHWGWAAPGWVGECSEYQ